MQQRRILRDHVLRSHRNEIAATEVSHVITHRTLHQVHAVVVLKAVRAPIPLPHLLVVVPAKQEQRPLGDRVNLRVERLDRHRQPPNSPEQPAATPQHASTNHAPHGNTAARSQQSAA